MTARLIFYTSISCIVAQNGKAIWIQTVKHTGSNSSGDFTQYVVNKAD